MTDGGASSWGQVQAPSYMRVHRSSTTFINSSLPNPRHHNCYQPLPPIQGVRGNNINVRPQATAVSYRLPPSYAPQNNPMNPSQESLEMGSRHVRPMPPGGLRIYRSHRGGVVPGIFQRHRNLPYLRVLPPDNSQEFYEDVDNFIDHHRDMRLDVEDMSYELSQGTSMSFTVHCIDSFEFCQPLYGNLLNDRRNCLHLGSGLAMLTLGCQKAAPVDLEADSCIVCQEEYKNQEKIGTLDCGHEYHADCLKKWLLVKNVCPICKTEALAT
ncbi:hypothetical protein SLEP1_g27069 [Rubroshorea leprosula]|uniref:RING-type E3 ubiquitin transferase n=1 Tax=Rubroshorea leprosula TaxID=152421 RepID=A0AAV5JXX0_9ROSI|nr:hypothetical protein SLEP1_g27069 [Rubroshorea leprosula]